MTELRKILIVGGIYDFPPSFRESITPTPEMNLVSGLRERGYTVYTLGHHALRSDTWRRSIDVVHVHHFGRGLARALLLPTGARATVFTRHAWGPTGSLIRDVGLAWARRHLDAEVALHARELQLLRSTGVKVAARVANGMAFNSPIPAMRVRSDERLQLLYVGKQSRAKGGMELAHLCRQGASVPFDIQLRVASHHPGDREVADALRAAGNAVVFLGRLSRDELNDEYARAHALVLPSFSEALPSVVGEALGMGLPVLATPVGGIPDLARLAPGAVLFFDPGKPRQLVAQVVELWDRYPDYAASAFHAAAGVRDSLSLDQMVDGHISTYLDALEAAGPA